MEGLQEGCGKYGGVQLKAEDIESGAGKESEKVWRSSLVNTHTDNMMHNEEDIRSHQCLKPYERLQHPEPAAYSNHVETPRPEQAGPNGPLRGHGRESWHTCTNSPPWALGGKGQQKARSEQQYVIGAEVPKRQGQGKDGRRKAREARRQKREANI